MSAAQIVIDGPSWAWYFVGPAFVGVGYIVGLLHADRRERRGKSNRLEAFDK